MREDIIGALTEKLIVEYCFRYNSWGLDTVHKKQVFYNIKI